MPGSNRKTHRLRIFPNLKGGEHFQPQTIYRFHGPPIITDIVVYFG